MMSKTISILDRLTWISLLIFTAALPVSISASQIALGIALLSWIALAVAKHELPIKKSALLILVLLFTGWALLSALASPYDRMHALWRWGKDFWLVVIFFIISSEVKTWPRVRVLLSVFCVTATVAACYGIFQHFTVQDYFGHHVSLVPWSPRCSGFFNSPMTFAYQQILVLPIAIFLGWINFRSQKKKSILWFIAASLIAAGVTFSFSRGAWLGMIISLIVIAYFINKIVGRVILASVIAFSVLVLILAPTSLFATRARAFFRPHEVVSTQERFYMWQSALAIAADHPLFGAGWGNFTPAHAEYKMPGDIWAPACNAHSNYFTALADAGWVGFGIFLLLTIESMMITWRIARARNKTDICNLGYGLFGSMLAISIASISQTSLVDAEVAMLFFLLLGIVNNTQFLEQKS